MTDDYMLPLAINYAEAWLLNARVRDNALDPDYRNMPDWLRPDDISEAPQFNPAELALKIIRAEVQQALDTATNTEQPTILKLTLAEAWYLERRFRHTDPDAAARGFIKRIHTFILQFEAPSLPKWVEEAIDDACRTNQNAHPDTGPYPDEGACAVP